MQQGVFRGGLAPIFTFGVVVICLWRPLHGASFTSVAQLREHIDAFIETYNQHAKPFVWTKARVHQKRIKVRFAEQ